MWLKNIRGIIACAIWVTGCGDDGLSGAAASKHLTATIILPGEGESLVDPPVDPSVSVSGGGGGGGVVTAGDTLMVSIPFESENANVVAAGIRFGDTGPIRTVPIPGASGQSAGTLQFQAQIPPGICGDLSSICHDIKCYEFAVTSEGKVSRANVTALAMRCGNCDEPSCQGLIEECVELDDACRQAVEQTLASLDASSDPCGCHRQLGDCFLSSNCDQGTLRGRCYNDAIACSQRCHGLD